MNPRTPKLKTYRFRITPTNEGQDINYSEVFETKAYAKADAENAATIRENQIVAGLMELLPSGAWDCEVEAL